MTGASTGALAAPIAFLGTDYDDILAESHIPKNQCRCWFIAQVTPKGSRSCA